MGSQDISGVVDRVGTRDCGEENDFAGSDLGMEIVVTALK